MRHRARVFAASWTSSSHTAAAFVEEQERHHAGVTLLHVAEHQPDRLQQVCHSVDDCGDPEERAEEGGRPGRRPPSAVGQFAVAAGQAREVEPEELGLEVECDLEIGTSREKKRHAGGDKKPAVHNSATLSHAAGAVVRQA